VEYSVVPTAGNALHNVYCSVRVGYSTMCVKMSCHLVNHFAVSRVSCGALLPMLSSPLVEQPNIDNIFGRLLIRC